MPEFNISWVIQLQAENPVDAAEQALQIHRDQLSKATHFQVTDEYGNQEDVDAETSQSCPSILQPIFLDAVVDKLTGCIQEDHPHYITGTGHLYELEEEYEWRTFRLPFNPLSY